MKRFGPAWLEVEATAIAYNVRNSIEYVKKVKNDTKLLAVVKADGYGHGAVEIARIMEKEGVDYFGVATIFEGIELRNSGVITPILILGYTPEELIHDAIKHNLTLTIYNEEMAKKAEQCGERLNKLPKVHIKINTGMSRLGFQPSEESINSISEIYNMKLNLEGIFSHFAMADSIETKPTIDQANRFIWVTKKIESIGIDIPIKHICNSAGMMAYPEYHFDMVRAGGILYGHNCLINSYGKNFIKVNQALSIRAVIANILEVKQDTGVSYGWKYRTDSKKLISTISIGYTDGISRRNTNRAEFLLKGRRINQVGLICMDQMMLDISDVEGVKIGDIVTLLGSDGDEHISLEERALAGEVGKAEMFASIGRRLMKVYKLDGQVYHSLNYLTDKIS